MIGFKAKSNATQYSAEQLTAALEKARSEKDNKALADLYFDLAMFELNETGSDAQSFKYLTFSSDYYKMLSDSLNYAKTQRQIGLHFIRLENYKAAKPILRFLKNYFEKIDDKYQLAISHNDLAKLYALENDFENQNIHLEELNKLNTELENIPLKLEYSLQRINQYFFENRIDLALDQSEAVLAIADSLDLRKYKWNAEYFMGMAYQLKKEYRKSIKLYSSSLNSLPKKPLDKNKLELYNKLSQTYSKINAYSKAHGFSQKYILLKDSIFNQARNALMNDLTIKYEARKTTTENEKLKLENEFAESKHQQQQRAVYVLFFMLGLLCLAIYYIVSFYTQRMQSNMIINEQRDEISEQKILELENKIKINSMQSMIEGQEQERERIAKDLHDSLGGLLSTIKLQFGNLETKVDDIKAIDPYVKANDLLDTAVKEVRFISQNLQPGALNNLGLIPALKDLINRAQSSSGPEIHFQYYDMPEKLDNMFALNIYRIIQELLNNAIKYASATEILIQLNREGDDLVLLFEDDGIGFDPSQVMDKGMGMENIKSRVNYLKGTLELDARPNEGSSFMIHAKLK